MEKDEIKTKLKQVINQFCPDNDATPWSNEISAFSKKLELLFDKSRYNGLLKGIFRQNNVNQFNDYAFEASFAYDFESKDEKLIYEVKKRTDDNTSIDFIYKFDDFAEMCFELGMKHRPENNNSAEDLEMEEIIKVQNKIKEKCEDEDGNPIKFGDVKEGIYHFIVFNVSEPIYNMFDKISCKLVMYGDEMVSSINRRGIFGLCQQLPKNAPDCIKEHYSRFQHFRETIHGVLFVKNLSIGNTRYICSDMEYLLINNYNLLEKQEFEGIVKKLESFLKAWPK